MFKALQKTPPQSYQYTTIQQILAANRTLVAQASRGELKIVPGSDPPLDAYFKRFAVSNEVTCYMNPLPSTSGNAASASQPDKTSGKGEPSIKGKGDKDAKGAGKGTGKPVGEMLKNLPENCQSKLPNGKFLCLRYQWGQCRFQCMTIQR